MTRWAIFTEHRAVVGRTAEWCRQANIRFASLFILLFSLFGLVSSPRAAELAVPTGPVVFSVTGQIQVRNAGDQADFDYQLLQSLPQNEIRTGTPWTDGEHVYRGVLLSDLLARVGARGKIMRANALNDYHVDIPLQGLRHYPVLLATHQDGKKMRIRDKGPVWIILPLKDYPELNTKRHHETMVWQLRSLDIR
ncbi:molybdopterin-dependent oxidoreductase [Zobellella maritima]|uniref:molybdopterin-dependent oxidoreductase n=1 Tax=Zobellella maritima TaxID=2059725 RepID=UPI000E30662F|nr:molybdopterin-dependent oxidoreductase [Zobellella maritima]